MMRYLIDPPEGSRYGFPKPYVGELDCLNYDAWLAAHGYPAEMLAQFPGGKYCRLIELGELAGCGMTAADIDLVDKAVPHTGIIPEFEVGRLSDWRKLEDPNAIIALLLGTPSEHDLRRTVAAYGAGRVFAVLLWCAGTGTLSAHQTARSAILLSCIVSDLGREAELELDAHRSPWSHPVEARRRVSGAGMRTYLNVCAKLGIAGDDRIGLLGSPPRFEFDEWCKAAENHTTLTMPEGALLSISAMFGIYAALQCLYDDQNLATWAFWEKHILPISCRPIEHMTRGLDELLEMRRWLEAQIQTQHS